MAIHGPEAPSDFDIDCCLSEFAELDRRRLFGAPALEVSEVEYWLELRAQLERQLGDRASDGFDDPRWSGEERREFIRLPTHIRIHITEPADAEPRVARDVSQGGLFIATRCPLPIGSEVRLQLEQADSVIEVSGTVVRLVRATSAERPAGMGIRFAKLTHEQRQAISRLVQRAPLDDSLEVRAGPSFALFSARSSATFRPPREPTNALVGPDHSGKGTAMAIERTLCIIKPDAVAKGATGEILRRIEAEGLQIVGLKRIQLSERMARGFYAVHKARPFYADLVKFMTSGPVVPAVLEGEGAIAKWRALMGPTNSNDAPAGTIRGDFGTDVERNASHGSDAPETAKLEISFLFNAGEIQADVEAL